MIDKCYSYYSKFYNCHLYNSKAEAIFKTVLITISWLGGIHLSKEPAAITREIASSFYLFSMALIMEYIIKWVTQKDIYSKVFPFLIVMPSILVLFLTSAELFERSFSWTGYNLLFWSTVIPQFVIWFDMLTMVLIEPPRKMNIEDTLTEDLSISYEIGRDDQHLNG